MLGWEAHNVRLRSGECTLLYKRTVSGDRLLWVLPYRLPADHAPSAPCSATRLSEVSACRP